uniref:Inositol polyphosphate-related phosphatase domain-containing protein n=1 Tax=Ditylenchus dipsaci TaxID=166011 RepID=A0A915CZB8_9BILA
MEKWKVTTITYNVNKQKASKKEIAEWLNGEEGLCSSDLACIAMQEISHAEMLAAIPQCSSWTDHLSEWMVHHELVLVNKLYLASNLLLVYCTHRLLHMIYKVETRWSRNSFGGVAGYKGTISVRVLFKDDLASITFITSHFFHAEKNFRKRIQQYHRSLVCTFEDDVHAANTPRAIFWLGDLNSRVEGFTYSNEMIERLNSCTPDDLKGIVEGFDQLTKSRRAGEAFVEFEEPTITFKPTYRIKVGLGIYDDLRIPSWCDRVLYKTFSGLQLVPERYSSSHLITLSDHFPVSAVFQLTLPTDRQECKASPSASLQPMATKWSCHFEHIPTWAQHIPLVCRFSFRNNFWKLHGSYGDWLGVYPAGVGNVSNPIHWVYMMTTCYEESNQPNAKTVAEFPSLKPGYYRVGYFSVRKNCLHGMSEVFRVDEHLGC